MWPYTTKHTKSIVIRSGNGTARSVKHDLAGCNFSDVGNRGYCGQFLAYGWANNLDTHLLNSDVDTICIYDASVIHLFTSICLRRRNAILEKSARGNSTLEIEGILGGLAKQGLKAVNAPAWTCGWSGQFWSCGTSCSKFAPHRSDWKSQGTVILHATARKAKCMSWYSVIVWM